MKFFKWRRRKELRRYRPGHPPEVLGPGCLIGVFWAIFVAPPLYLLLIHAFYGGEEQGWLFNLFAWLNPGPLYILFWAVLLSLPSWQAFFLDLVEGCYNAIEIPARQVGLGYGQYNRSRVLGVPRWLTDRAALGLVGMVLTYLSVELMVGFGRGVDGLLAVTSFGWLAMAVVCCAWIIAITWVLAATKPCRLRLLTVCVGM